jgi:hypothetical protein
LTSASDINSGNAKCYIREYNYDAWYYEVPVVCAYSSLAWSTTNIFNIQNRYLRANTLYEFIISSDTFDNGIPNIEQTTATFLAESYTKKISQTWAIQQYDEFLDL